MEGFRSVTGYAVTIAAAACACGFAWLSSPASAQDPAVPGLQDRSEPFRAAVDRFLGKTLGQRKIIGGQDANFADHPWQVALLVSWIADTPKAQFCGGSILNAAWVLTAAHCVNGNNPLDVHVLSGTADLASGGHRHNVKAIFVHKDYNPSNHDNDVALLMIDGTLQAGGPVALADAAIEARLAAPRENAMVTGWGVSESGEPSPTLKQVSVPIVSNADCNDPVSYNGAVTANMMCAGFSEGGKDSCQGDSGGPLTATDASGAAELVGVVSWGEGCAQPGKYGVYARVSKFASWAAKCMATPDQCEAKR